MTVSHKIRLGAIWPRAVLMLSFGALSWLLMQLFHECGHLFAALVSGGTVMRVVLHPLAFSRTDVSPNPHPLFEVWAGPVAGIVLPVAAWRLFHCFKWPGEVFVRCFAGCCAVANGVYIAFGPATEGMDTQLMLALGCARWQLAAFGASMIALGLWLWNGTGAAFGIGPSASTVPQRTALLALLVAIVVIVAELFVNAIAS